MAPVYPLLKPSGFLISNKETGIVLCLLKKGPSLSENVTFAELLTLRGQVPN